MSKKYQWQIQKENREKIRELDLKLNFKIEAIKNSKHFRRNKLMIGFGRNKEALKNEITKRVIRSIGSISSSSRK